MIAGHHSDANIPEIRSLRTHFIVHSDLGEHWRTEEVLEVAAVRLAEAHERRDAHLVRKRADLRLYDVLRLPPSAYTLCGSLCSLVLDHQHLQIRLRLPQPQLLAIQLLARHRPQMRLLLIAETNLIETASDDEAFESSLHS